MEKRGQYRKNNLGMFVFLIALVIGLYYILGLGLRLITLSFITDSVNNIIMVIGGVIIIISGFMFMRRGYSPQTVR